MNCQKQTLNDQEAKQQELHKKLRKRYGRKMPYDLMLAKGRLDLVITNDEYKLLKTYVPRK